MELYLMARQPTKKMASILGVKGTLTNTRNWFQHPLNDDRKLFVFSDIPHVLKNIRNRLYNKRRLKAIHKSLH